MEAIFPAPPSIPGSRRVKVLLLSPAYPPQQVVGALRAGNLVQVFLDAGHEVIVLAEQLPGRPEGPDPLGRRLRIVQVPMGAPFAKRLHGLLSRLRPGKGLIRNGAIESPTAASTESGEPSGALRQFALSVLSVPDLDQHMILPLVRAGRQVLTEGVDLIYSTAPPFSGHVAGLLLKELTRTPWVAEFRDPWNHPWSDRLAARHPVTRALDGLLERWVLRRADAVVAVTEAARGLLASRLPEGQDGKVLLARNGIPDGTVTEPVPPIRAAGPFTILYAGSLYMGRDPVRFLEGLARFIAVRRLRPEDVQVRFIGRCSEFDNASVAGLAESLGLTGYLHVEDWVPFEEIGKLTRSADVLLVFAQKQPLQVPNKVYEYLAAGTPILGFVDRDGESARLLRDSGGTELLFDPDAAEVSAALERLYDGRDAHPERRPPPRELRTGVQLGNLVEELTRRFSPRGR